MRVQKYINAVALRAIAAALLLSFTVLAQAQNSSIKVYRDQYIIEQSSAIAADEAAAWTQELGVRTLERVGKGTLLVTPALIAAGDGAPEVVPYNPSASICPELLKSNKVASCSPNFQLTISAIPSDPSFAETWGLNATQGINAAGAWDIAQGSSATVVAVLDTGIDYTHPDLAANVWTNSAEIPGNGVDDDTNGYVDDVHGINAATGSGNPMDDNGHGSHVSGTIGAVGNNGVGVAGINWHVKIMGLKFLNASGSGSLGSAIKAIEYMVMMKHRGVDIRVSNNSWGGGSYSEALNTAIVRARNAGIIFVAAAGNESNDNDATPSYPAGYELDNVVSVAAIDSAHNVAGFSNYGAESVDIAAPGVEILSTVPGGYKKYSGTSMATPHVAGALALLLSAEPGLTYTAAIERLYAAGVEFGTLNGLVRTSRALNVSRMLHNETVPLPPHQTPVICPYAVEEIAALPDVAADSAAIVQQADETNFVTVELPFQFPFHGQMVSTIYVSPNGVVYTKNAPATLDYQNGAQAPLNSIAALHTDLISAGDPYGTRVYTDSEKAVIYWKTKQYAYRTGGDVGIRLVLHSDGRIEDYLTIEDPAALHYIQAHGTVGISGGVAAGAVTFAANSSSISANLAIRYTPQCVPGEQAPTISSITVTGLGGSGQPVKKLLPGKLFQVDVLGQGSGTVALSLALNSRSCADTKLLHIAGGVVSVGGQLPRAARQIRNVRFGVSGVTGAAQIGGVRKNSKSSVRRLSTHRFANLCTQIMTNLQ